MGTLLYYHGSGRLHRIHPLTKLCFLAWSSIAAFSLPWQISLSASMMVFAVCAFRKGEGKRIARFWLVTIFPLAIALSVLHGFLLQAPDVNILGRLQVSRQGLVIAAGILGRIGFLLISSLLVLVTTHPSQILKALDAKGFPPGFSYLIASPLLIADLFVEKARAIRDSQQARGLKIDGAPWTRIRTLPSMLIPLVVVGLDEAHNRSYALTARAFRALPRRTVVDPPRDRRYERWLRFFLLTAAILQGGLALWRY